MSPSPTAFLEHHLDEAEPPARTVVDQLPFRIGRGPTSHLRIYSPRVSKDHAEIVCTNQVYTIRDLGSRNGTFVNGERVRESRLTNGDVIHIAHKELRFGRNTRRRVRYAETLGGQSVEQQQLILGTRDFQRILAERRVRAVFQPVVQLMERRVIGHEALGRHSLPEAHYNTGKLFSMAAQRGRSADLSRLMRAVALKSASEGKLTGRLFFNVHPDEMSDGQLLGEMEYLLRHRPENVLPVVEIHESAVTDLSQMRALRLDLHAMGIEVAYDDFGAGRSRLMELAEVPPDVLKLDMSLIQGIEGAPARQELVRALIHVMKDSGVEVLAEGIETRAELEVCRELGCELGQGFLLGRPVSIESSDGDTLR